MPSKQYNLKNENAGDCENNNNDEWRIMTYDDAIEEIGFGKIQIFVFISTFLLLTNVINETMGISFIIPAAVCDLKLTPTSKGLLNGITYFGVMIASFPLGFLADTKGRRIVTLWTVFGSTFCTTASVFMQNFLMFLVFRFFTGVCLAGYSAVMYSYLGEHVSNARRASILVWVTTSVGIATLTMPLLAFWILSYDWSFEVYDGFVFKPWRLLLLTYTIPGILGALILLIKLRPSPKFLLSVKRDSEALENLQWMYSENKKKEFKLKNIECEASDIAKGSKSFCTLLAEQSLPLLKPPYLKYFATCCALMCGLFSIASGIAMYMPEILNRLALVNDIYEEDFKICDIYKVSVKNEDVDCSADIKLEAYVQTMFVGVGYTVGFIILSLIVRRHNRTLLMHGSFAISGICGIVLTFVYNEVAIIVLFSMFALFAGLNVPLINGCAVDIFPTYLRAMAVGCSMLFGRFGSTIATNVVGNLIDNYCEATFYTFASVALACAAISFIIPRPK